MHTEHALTWDSLDVNEKTLQKLAASRRSRQLSALFSGYVSRSIGVVFPIIHTLHYE